jgi:hypothetical protein
MIKLRILRWTWILIPTDYLDEPSAITSVLKEENKVVKVRKM